MLDGRGFGEKTESHETKCDSWQVGLKKSPEDPIVFQQGESFTQSKKMCSKLVNPKGKIPKPRDSRVPRLINPPPTIHNIDKVVYLKGHQNSHSLTQ